MLVDAQDGRTSCGVPFTEVALQTVPEVALDGGGSNAFAFSHPAAVDPIQVLPEDGFPESFAGVLARQNAGKALPKLPPALQAAPLARRQFQAAMAQPPRFMPHQPAIPALAPLVLAAAMRTGFRPGIPGRNPHLATRSLNPGNLVPRQAQNDLIVGQNVISQDCFTNLGSGPAPVFDQEPIKSTGCTDS